MGSFGGYLGPVCNIYIMFSEYSIKKRAHVSGQIIATSHHATPNCGLVREITLCQGNLGW